MTRRIGVLGVGLALAAIAGCGGTNGSGDVDGGSRDSGTTPLDGAADRDGAVDTDGAADRDGAVDTDGAVETDAAAQLDGSGGGVSCGPVTCEEGMVCCNESCGICTPPDGSCIDLACVDAGGADRDAGGSLTICGGFIGAACERDEWCDYDDGGLCGGADGTGVCRDVPVGCPRIFDPVCGCDGNDYDNECLANAAGVDIARRGSCSTTDTTFACGTTRCMTFTEYCEVTVGGIPGAMRYSCSAIPDRCSAAPSCTTCFPGGGVDGRCMDGGPGEITVTLLAP